MGVNNILDELDAQFLERENKIYVTDDSREFPCLVRCYDENNTIHITVSYPFSKVPDQKAITKIKLLNETCHSGVFQFQDTDLTFKTSIHFVTKPDDEAIDSIITEVCSKMKAVLLMLERSEETDGRQ